MDAIIGYFQETGKLFLEMAPYLTLGLIFVAVLNVLITKKQVSKHLGEKNFRSVLKASLFGIPLPLCSCGVVPTAVFLEKEGASKGSVVSFLISTPQTGVDSVLATYGMMGGLFAVYRPVAAFFMGIFGGAIANVLEKKNVEGKFKFSELKTVSSEAEEDEIYESGREKTVGKSIAKAAKYAFVEFLDDISKNFAIGLLIAGLITYFIPDNFFSSLGFNSGILAYLIMIVIGMPMYVCATGSIPIAAALMLKGFSPGAAFVFLAAGPATNAASFAVVSKVLGKKSSIVYLTTIALLSIAFGAILDYLFAAFGINPIESLSATVLGESGFSWFEIAVGAFFGIALAASLYRTLLKPYFRKLFGGKEMPKSSVKIEGMTCRHCVANVERAIKNVPGVKSAEVSLETSSATIDGNFDLEEIKKAVESVGYKVVA